MDLIEKIIYLHYKDDDIMTIAKNRKNNSHTYGHSFE